MLQDLYLSKWMSLYVYAVNDLTYPRLLQGYYQRRHQSNCKDSTDKDAYFIALAIHNPYPQHKDNFELMVR